MPSYEQIENQIEGLGFQTKLLPKSEMKALPNFLSEDETIKGIASGLYKERNGILVATNKRIFFFATHWLRGTHSEEFRYENITSVEYDTGIIGGDITIYSAGNATKISMVPNMYCQSFADAVREIIRQRQSREITLTKDDLLLKLERLATLKNSGMLTDEEFKAAKAKLLDL